MTTMTKREEIARTYAEIIMMRKLMNDMELEPKLKEIVASKARASHEGWLAAKAEQGYVYGPTTNDDPNAGALTNPNMVEWDELDEETKSANVDNAEAIVKLMKFHMGAEFQSFDVLVRRLAAEIHDEWCRTKLKDGWIWGPITDKEHKVHRDLLPFRELLNDPVLCVDCRYDVDTAKQFLISLITEADIFPVFSN